MSSPLKIAPPSTPGLAKTALLLAWMALALTLAWLFHYFADAPAALDALLFYGRFPSKAYRENFFQEGAGYFLGGMTYLAVFVFLGRRQGLIFRQTLAALAPGLTGCVLFAAFLYADAPRFAQGAERYVLTRLPFLLALLWPVWRLGLWDAWTPADWSPPARRVAGAVWWGLAGLFIFNGLGHALAKWSAWANNLTDLGLYVQMVWGWTRGRFLLNTSYALPGDCFLQGEHALLTTVLLAPLGWLPDVALGLILAQSAFLLAGAALVWRIARDHSRLWWAPWVLALIYLSTPWVERGWIDDFHIDALEVPLFFALWMVATKGQGWRRVVVFSILSLAYLGCKEDAGLTYGALGAALLFHPRGRWLGLAALFIGPAASLALVKWIAHYRPSAHVGNYGPLGSSAGEVAKTVLTRPDIVIEQLAAYERRLSLARLIFSTGLLCLLAPELLLAAGGAVLATLLSEMDFHHELRTHYGLDFLGPIMLAAAVGWGRLEGWIARSVQLPQEGEESRSGPRWREFQRRCAICALGALVLAFSAHREGAKHSAFKPGDWRQAYPDQSERRAGFWERVAPRIAPNEGLAAPGEIGSLLAAREVIVWFPPPGAHRVPWDDWRLHPRVDVVLSDALGEVYWPQDVADSVRHVMERDNFVPEYYWEGFLLLRRNGQPPDPDEAAAWLADFEAKLGVGRRQK
jgi:uncharacterized membrane protein